MPLVIIPTLIVFETLLVIVHIGGICDTRGGIWHYRGLMA